MLISGEGGIVTQKMNNVYLVSHIGNSRDNQEDNFFISPHVYGGNNVEKLLFHEGKVEYESRLLRALVAVSDGMGGHACGEIASRIVVEQLENNQQTLMTDSSESVLVSLISKINEYVQNEAKRNSEQKGMGATLCGFLSCSQRILGFNVGDSRLYRFENGYLTQLSKDHNEGQRLLDLNLLTKEELKTFPNCKAIYKYIGMKTDLVADVFDIEPCEKGTILLLCTDGLTDVLADSEIQNILNKGSLLKEKGELLLNTALERNVGHGDNITIILTEF